MARLLSETRCLALFLALMVHDVTGIRTGRFDLEVTSNQAPEAFTGSTLNVHEGDRLTLTCLATGTDPRRVFWFESTTLLKSADRRDAKDPYSNTLVLDPIQAADDGRILACRASTQQQKVTLKVQKIANRGFQLHISANPPEALSSEEDIVMVNVGSKLELTCNLQGVVPHRLSWWCGQEQIPPVGKMGPTSATSVLTLRSVGVTDHLKTFTCRADGSTIARTVTLEVQGIQDISPKAHSILEEIQKDPTLLSTGLIVALVCGLLLIIACLIIIKALQTYLQISMIRDKQVKNEQQEALSSSNRRSQRKTPTMKQSLKNQILASTALLPQTNATEAGTDNTDRRDTNESDPMNEDGDKGGENNPTFVEEV